MRSSIRTVSIRGHRLRIDIRPGTGEGVPLVMCCGIGASFEALQPLVDAIDPAIEVIRFDVPGVGGSPVGMLPLGFPQLARLLGGLLDELGHERVDVLGFSWGGGLAQQFALQHPRRCRRLVLVSTGTGMLMVPGRPGVLLRMASPRRFRDPSYSARVAGILYGGAARASASPVHQILRNQLTPASRRGYLYQLLAGAGWTSLPFLPLLRQPTLVIGGADDPIVPAVNARIMAALLSRPRLLVHPGGHVDPLLNPAPFGSIITDFLAAPTAPSRRT